MLVLVNFLAFQIGWFASVMGAANNIPWLGPLVVLGVLALHLSTARDPSNEVKLALTCALLGTIFDSALVASGLVAYASGVFNDSLSPYWIITMWALFATTLNVSMRWLRRSAFLAAVFGFIGGPLAYFAGQKLGGIILVEQTAALLALAIGWGAIMPLLMRLASHLDGMPDAQHTVSVAEVS